MKEHIPFEDRITLPDGTQTCIYYDDIDCTILAEGKYKEALDYFWYKQGVFHREDGPAMIWNDGEQEWCLKGETIFSDDGNNLDEYDVSEELKRSIIKYELSK